MKSLEALITEVEAAGFLVNNLAHLSPTKWRANLRSRESAFEFGEGASAREALEEAFTKARSAEGVCSLREQDSNATMSIEVSAGSLGL